MKKFILNSEIYLVTKSLGQRATDLMFDVYEGKKENGRKKVTVKIDRLNGQCFEC